MIRALPLAMLALAGCSSASERAANATEANSNSAEPVFSTTRLSDQFSVVIGPINAIIKYELGGDYYCTPRVDVEPNETDVLAISKRPPTQTVEMMPRSEALAVEGGATNSVIFSHGSGDFWLESPRVSTRAYRVRFIECLDLFSPRDVIEVRTITFHM